LIDFQDRLFAPARDIEKNQVVLPIGLLYISSYLKARIPHHYLDIKLVKSFVDFRDRHQLLNLIKEFQPGIIGIRCLALDLLPLLDWCKFLRNNYKKKGIIIVLGGPVTSSKPRELSRSGLFDYIVVGEGEKPFYEIVNAYMNRQPPGKPLKGVVDENGNYEKDMIDNLDELPFPDYDLLNFSKYDRFLNYGYNRSRQGVLLTSRGCPYKCVFCHNIFGRKTRLRSPENVMEEIVYLNKNYHINDFFIADDIFNINYRRAMRLFDLIIASRLNLHLYFPNGIRGDIVDAAYIDRMVEAGTRFVTYAVETASPRLQKLINKNIDLEKLKDNIIYTCNKEILVNAFFLFGLPTETEEEALMTLKYAEELEYLNFPFIFFSRYYPGTEMYEIALKNGFTREMLTNSTQHHYHDIDHYYTPTLSNPFIQFIKNYFLYKIIYNKNRIAHMLDLQSKFYSPGEIPGFIGPLHHMNLESIAQFQRYVEMLEKSSYIKKILQIS
jgi:radical SAM superfamily enzyme YgiQ (UPF0313 family)